MQGERHIERNGAYSMSITAMFTAVTLLVLYLAFIFPEARLILMFVASLFSFCVMCEQNMGLTLLLIGLTTLLGFLIIPEKMMIVPYVLFFAHYGVFKYFLESKKKNKMNIVYKLIYFDAAFVGIYFIYPDFLLQSIPGNLPFWAFAVILEAGFLAYDYLYALWGNLYSGTLRKTLKNSMY